MREIRKIVVHHTGSRALGKLDNRTLIKIRHLLRGYEDIGYHYLIGTDGKVYEGRNEQFNGAHAYGHNSDSIGISLIGNFERGFLKDEQEIGAIKFLSDRCRYYQLKPNEIYGHRELDNADTVCPGRNVDMDLLRRKVLENMAIEDIKFSRFLHEDVLGR